MTHQCIRCGSLYDDGNEVILKGCDCGSKLFFYVKKDKLERSRDFVKGLSVSDKDKIESDVMDIMGHSTVFSEEPVVLDFETIKINGSGKFNIDLVKLMNNDNPLVYELEEGKYMIDLPESFRKNNSEIKLNKKKR